MPTPREGLLSRLFAPVTKIFKQSIERDSSDRSSLFSDADKSAGRRISDFFSNIFRGLGNIISPRISAEEMRARVREGNFIADSVIAKGVSTKARSTIKPAPNSGGAQGLTVGQSERLRAERIGSLRQEKGPGNN